MRVCEVSLTSSIKQATSKCSSRRGRGGPLPREYASSSSSVSSRGPFEQTDAYSSEYDISETARQKKSHPIKRPTCDLSVGISKLMIDGVVRIPNRPDRGGTVGKKVTVTSNCWDFAFSQKTVYSYFLEVINVYRVDTKEGSKTEIRMPPREKRSLIQQIVNSLPDSIIYDGGHVIYSEEPFPGISTDPVEKEINIKDPLGRDQLLLSYRIMEVQKVSTSDVNHFIKSPKATSLNMPQESIRLLDCILKTVSKQSFVSLGRSALFYDKPIKMIADKLFTIHKGFITSVRPQWKVRINLDMTCKAFFTAGNLADVMYEKYGDNMARCSTQMAHDLRRIRVETEKFYKSDNGNAYSRRFTVHGISSVPANQLMIEELKQSVAAYFDQHHHIKLKYPELPCVKVDQKREVYMPMELLNILPYQAPNASKAEVASEVVRCAAVRPQERFQELQTFANNMLKSHPLINQFGLTVQPRPVVVNARVIHPPSAAFGRSHVVPLKAGSWISPGFHDPAGRGVELLWAILCVPPDRRSQGHIQKVMHELPRAADRVGMRLSSRPSVSQCPTGELNRRFDEFSRQGCSFLLLILYDDYSYPTIKRLSDLQMGIRTQCVRGRTLDKPNVFPNLLLKLNGKLGGVNWQIPDLIKNGNELIMVFGADVTHPAPTQNQQIRKSVAAVIGSVSPDLMRYGVVIRQQATTEKGNKTAREIIDDMRLIVKELLQLYLRNTNGRFPNRMIFYRDGVSEGQFENVLVEELAAIQRACADVRPGEEPAITYIVVQKRHHIRFKPSDPRARNVEPGTIVDTEITHPREFDFYLCSQDGIQGTSKPAHYHVLYDDSNWTSDALQMFTYYLCYAYMRCSRSVSYPAPTYYSHLAAFRARDWLSGIDQPSALLDCGRFKVHMSQVDGMFYL
ncbi:Protein argonaute-2 [Schistosoma japonicum]|uniref:Protein argonaute-2 n=1 Tax=Schistosoma japonicum TaxID=6182 RepID=A0A4Z2D5Y9_SCHJA|nr:Protein argonaute-2 [Schistosoma japonicum]